MKSIFRFLRSDSGAAEEIPPVIFFHLDFAQAGNTSFEIESRLLTP
jgi:hypothetical protein